MIPALGIFGLTLIIYILTLSRSVYYGDSGEFITIAKTLGIAHPPGYPLYTMLAHLFTYLPFGNLPFKVNLFSAVTSSLTAVVVYFICLKLTKNRLASASASLFLAFSYLFWLYSLVADSYALNSLFIALLILISLYLFENPQSKKLIFLLSFVLGLSLTHHPTILFLAPAFVLLLVYISPKQILKLNILLPAILLFVLGLLPYLYLPIRAAQNPPLTWGDPDTVGRFLHHVLRKDYGTFAVGAGAYYKPYNFEVLAFYFSSITAHFAFIGPLLVLAGAILYPKNKQFFFLLLAFVFLGPILIFLTRLQITGNIDAKGAIQELFTVSYVILGIFIGLGLSEILQRAPGVLKRPTHIIALIFLVPLILNFPKVDQNKNFIFEDYGRQTFEILPQNSVVFVFGDRLSMISKYLQVAEGKRPDLKIINITLLPDDWYKENLKKFHPDFSFPYDKFQPLKLSEIDAGEIICQELIGKYPVFIENRTKGFDPANNKNCTNRPYKNLWELKPKDYKLTTEYLTSEYQNFWQPQIAQLSSKEPYDIRTKAVLLYSWSQPLTYLGVFLDENFNQKDKAYQIYQDAFSISPDNAIALYLSARKYLAQKDYETAEKIEKQALEINPTLPEPYRILGLMYLDVKKDKKTALAYFNNYLKYNPDEPKESQIRKLVARLKKETQ